MEMNANMDNFDVEGDVHDDNKLDECMLDKSLTVNARLGFVRKVYGIISG